MNVTAHMFMFNPKNCELNSFKDIFVLHLSLHHFCMILYIPYCQKKPMMVGQKNKKQKQKATEYNCWFLEPTNNSGATLTYKTYKNTFQDIHICQECSNRTETLFSVSLLILTDLNK